jgi:hypothetical protein
VTVLVGLSADPSTTPTHYHWAENMTIGLRGVSKGLRGLPLQMVDRVGVAIGDETVATCGTRLGAGASPTPPADTPAALCIDIGAGSFTQAGPATWYQVPTWRAFEKEWVCTAAAPTSCPQLPASLPEFPPPTLAPGAP